MPVREEMMDRVRDEGLDPHEVIRRGLLTLIPAQDAYLKNATFTPEVMVSFMRLQIIRKRAFAPPLRRDGLVLHQCAGRGIDTRT